MISLSVKKNTTETNLLRLVFFIAMALGIYIFFSPFVQVLGYLPIVGGFLAGTAGIIVFLGAILISIPLFMITFSLGWMRYHPVIGGSVLTAAIVMLVVFSVTGKK